MKSNLCSAASAIFCSVRYELSSFVEPSRGARKASKRCSQPIDHFSRCRGGPRICCLQLMNVLRSTFADSLSQGPNRPRHASLILWCCCIATQDIPSCKTLETFPSITSFFRIWRSKHVLSIVLSTSI